MALKPLDSNKRKSATHSSHSLLIHQLTLQGRDAACIFTMAPMPVP